MRPAPVRSPGSVDHAPLAPAASAAEAERELAMAWAALAARRSAPAVARRVRVLQPVAL